MVERVQIDAVDEGFRHCSQGLLVRRLRLLLRLLLLLQGNLAEDLGSGLLRLLLLSTKQVRLKLLLLFTVVFSFFLRDWFDFRSITNSCVLWKKNLLS